MKLNSKKELQELVIKLLNQLANRWRGTCWCKENDMNDYSLCYKCELKRTARLIKEHI